MRISLRLRRDFLVTDATRVLVAGRRAFAELNPDVATEDVEQHVTTAADAVFALLDRDGLVVEHGADGLAAGGYRAQLTINDPMPLSHPPTCFEGDPDVLALPPDDLLGHVR